MRLPKTSQKAHYCGHDLDENGEWAEVWSLSRRYSTAVKTHRCENCRTGIQPGETYYREFVISGGHHMTIKRHYPACQDGRPA